MRAVFALLLCAVATVTSGQDADCDLSDPTALSRCLKRLLSNSRDRVRREADPLRLPDHHDGDLRATGIVIRGIAGYSVDDLSITFPQAQEIAVRATISWPHIVGDLNVKVRKCKRIIFKICGSARARPHVTVGRTTGTLTTTLAVSVSPDGTLSVAARDTRVRLGLASIRVKANVRGLVGAINRLIGDPASRITTKIANKWWRNNRSRIEGKAKDALDKAVREDLSVHLAKLLKL